MGTIKSFDVGSLIEEKNIKHFVETGTFHGDGVRHASKFKFSSITSFEVESSIYDTAIFNLRDLLTQKERHVKVVLGDSGKKIAEQRFDGNTLFFLDAHFPGADEGLRDYDAEKDSDIKLPLGKELCFLATRQDKYDDIIIIDDLRLFVDFSEKLDLHRHLRNIGKGHISRDDLVHFDLFELIDDLFPSKTVIRDEFRDEGYIIIK